MVSIKGALLTNSCLDDVRKTSSSVPPSRYVQEGRDAINQIRRARRIKMFWCIGSEQVKNNFVTSLASLVVHENQIDRTLHNNR